MNFKLIVTLLTSTLVFSLSGLVVNAENTIHISGSFEGEGVVTGSAFNGNNKQKGLAAFTFERKDSSLNISTGDKQITYGCFIQQINTKLNNVTNWSIKCKVYDFTYADNYPGTVKTTGFCRIEVIKNKISLAQCDTKKKNTSANFSGS